MNNSNQIFSLGFEKDVFKAIVDYFQSLPEPLLTYELFEVFATAVIRCEILDQMCNDGTHSLVLKDGKNIQGFSCSNINANTLFYHF